MKVLGRIGGNEVVLDKSDGASSLRLVETLSDIPDGVKTVQLECDFGTYKRGTILVREDEEWKPVVPPPETVGDVSGIIYPRIGTDVQIRWTDPSDTDRYVWRHTRLMRKRGGFPVDPRDGVLVTDSYEKDQYTSSAWHDYVPAGTEDDWYYRFFTFSEDEVWHTSDLCCFHPIELTWEGLPQIIRNGLANRVYALGDTVTIPGDVDDQFFKSLEFEVVAFDQAQPENLELTKSITFALVGTFGNYPTVFDQAWPEFILTNDIRVTDRNKSYYIWDGNQFVEVTNLPLGKLLTPNTYYERSPDSPRKEDGGNRWSKSALRAWLNSIDPTNKWSFYGCEDPVKPIMTNLPYDLVSVITPVRNKTAYPSVDGRGAEVTIDRLFLLSQTEVFGDQIEEIFYEKTQDAVPQELYIVTSDPERVEGESYFVFDQTLKEYRSAKETDFNPDGSFRPGTTYYKLVPKAYFLLDLGGYRPCTDGDFTEDHQFKPDMAYYDQTIVTVEENPFIGHFDDPDLLPRIHLDQDGVARKWWLRTPEVSSMQYLRAVSEQGKRDEFPEHASKPERPVGRPYLPYLTFAFVIA